MKTTLVFLGCLLVSHAVHAQQNVGTLTGTVRDPSRGVIPGASAVARSVDSGVETSTFSSDSGVFTFNALAVGEYIVTVSHDAFQTVRQTGVRVIAGQVLNLDFDLPLGGLEDTIEVTATMGLEVASTTTGTTRVTEEIANLPLANQGGARNALQFLRTVPGVNLPGDVEDVVQTERSVVQGVGGTNLTTLGQFFASYDIDGVRASLNLSQGPREDGGPIPEVIAEFRQATNLDAEYGGDLGSTIQLITKSGTNDVHGTVFEYFRDSSLDARNWFASEVTPERQHEFGVVIGGPIRRNSLFFFGSYAGYRYRVEPSGVIATVPTARMRAGDFSEWLGPQIGTDVLGRPVHQGAIYDPATTREVGGTFVRDPFPGNVVPQSMLSSISQAFQTGYPLPSQSGLANNWVGSNAPSPVTMDKVSFRVDAVHGRNRLSVGYQGLPRKDQIYGDVNFAPEIARNVRVGTVEYHLQVNYYRLIRSDLLFQLRTGASQAPRDIGVIGLPSEDYGATAGMTGYYTPETPQVSIPGTTGFGAPWRRISDPPLNVPVNLDLTWTKGRHSPKVGAQYLHLKKGNRLEQGSGGGFAFSGGETQLPGFPQTGVGYASFLLGQVNFGSVQSPRDLEHSARVWSFYGQDSWRATPQLTVNYGLRWEFSVPPWEKEDRMASFDPSIPNPGAGGLLGAVTFWGDGPGRNGRRKMLDYYWRAFGPRLGIAYAPYSSTVIRTYYGINYAPSAQTNAQGSNMPSYGWNATLFRFSPDGGLTPAFQWDRGWPTPLPNLPNLDPTIQNGGPVNYTDPRLARRPPMSHNLGLSIGRQLPWGMMAEAGYVGKLTHRIPQVVNINQLDPQYLSLGFTLARSIDSPEAQAAGIPRPYPGFTGNVQTALLPYPQYPGGVFEMQASQKAFYHSGQMKLQKHYGQGLSFLVSYTIAKELDTAPGPNPYAGWIKELSILDRTHTLAISYSYELPFGQGERFLNSANPFLRHLVSNWSVAGIHAYMSGLPIKMGRWVNLTGEPIRTGIGCGELDPNDPAKWRYLNPAAFSLPPEHTLGTTNQLSGVRTCGYANENISLIKAIPLGREVKLRFAVNAFNVFNRHYWLSGIYTQGVNTNLNNPEAFGRWGTACTPFAKCSAATDPRFIQLMLKLDF